MKEFKLNYFGTDLRTHGHYLWRFVEGMLISPDRRPSLASLQFHPEEISKNGDKRGRCRYFAFPGITGVSISGSCVDKRGGTKSVFWVESEVSREKLREIIFSTDDAAKIIAQMDFDVDWDGVVS